MTGQGSPRTSPPMPMRALRLLGRLCGAALWMALMLSAVSATGAERSFRIRVAWGAGQPRLWRGTIAVEGGTVTQPRPLGIEADEPGSIWSEHGVTLIEQKSARSYDGCDLTVTAPDGARLTMTFNAADAAGPPVVIDVAVSELIASQHNSPLDEQGNRVLVSRLPGDMLRARMSSRETGATDGLVFWAGEAVSVEVTPHMLGLEAGTELSLATELSPAGGDDALWSDERSYTIPEIDAPPRSIPLPVPLPSAEGVYELHFSAQRGGFPTRIGLPKTVAERKVQFVVLERNPPAAPLRRHVAPREIEQLDPASPSWWDRLTSVPLVPGLRRGPLNGQQAETFEHALGTLVRLPPNGGREASWEAYPLPVRHPGTPHVLEVDLPSDVAGSLGISIVEPNAAGAVMPIGVDSGVYRAADAAEPTARWTQHRLIFWPRTKTPLVLMTNRNANAPAVYGRIRLLRYDGRLPSAYDTGGARPERLLAGYYARPLFAENFSATESLDATSGRSLEDWVTFYQGATRLVDYLNHTGRNGLMLSVLADGSTIYPSSLLDPTPRYDTGVFFASGQDPVRKDVLELLLRLFDREGLKLIPALHFSAPLPELERIKREGGPGSVGLEWVGADGKTWLEADDAGRGQAPYYNLLNPRVQQAMLGVVRELTDRYGRHAAFHGVAVVLSAEGYAQLPGSKWGYDDDTVAAYQRDMGIRLPEVGPDKFTSRDQILSGEQRSTWLDWRAGKLADFYRLVQAEVARTKPDAKLFLASADSLSGRDSRADLSPTLPRTVSVPQALLEVGIDLENYAGNDNVVLTRPVPIGPLDDLYRESARAVDLAITQATTVDARFIGASTTASLLYHPPQQGRLESFERKSPFQPTYSWQVAQLSPAGSVNRRRFVHALATMDAQVLIDGGWLLPLGQEDNLQELVEVYRRLPGGRFQTVEGATQPVTIRTLKRDDRTYVYMVNDSPWPVLVEVDVAARGPVQMESLSARMLPHPLGQRGEHMIWNVRLEPYDLVGCRFGGGFGGLLEPRVRFAQPDVLPRLEKRIEGLWRRAEVLKVKRPLDGLENGGFDAPTDRMNEVPGWRVVGGGTPEVTVETYLPHLGTQSLRFLGNGRVSSLWSNTFAPPRTGRLAVSVWLRVPDASRQPPLRLAIEGKLNGASYYRHALVGDAPGNEIHPQWKPFIFPVPDLPLEGLTDLRVRFDLMGPGEVWIDSVEVFESAFTQQELTELGSIIKLASDYLQRGQVRDAHHVMEGYWPRFLTDRVTLPPASLAVGNPPLPPRDAATPPPKKQPGFLQGWKNRLVPGFLR